MSSKRKHQPQRTCVACRQVKDKRSLVRIVKTPDQQIIVDTTAKTPGRGAYLCLQTSCWERALQGALARALKTNLSQEDKEQIKKYASQLVDQ